MPVTFKIRKFFFEKIWIRVFILIILYLVSSVHGPAKDLGWINFFAYLIEDFSILISGCIFIIYFSIRSRIKDIHSHLIGTGFLIIGLLDFYRAVTGPDVTPMLNSILTLHYELRGLVVDSILFLLLALIFIPEKRQIRFNLLSYAMPIAALLTGSLIVLFTIHPNFLPVIYVAGIGRTSFYFYSKIMMMILFAFCSYKFYEQKVHYEYSPPENAFYFQKQLAKYENLARASRALAGVSLAMAIYNFDNDLNDQLIDIFINFFKMVSFILFYRAVVKSTLLVPYIENEMFSADLENKIKNAESLEKELQNTRKLALVGQQVGSIAHDLGNLLMMIAVNNDRFLELEDYTQVEENVSNLHSNINKSKAFISSLIRFTRNIDQPLARFKIAEFVESFRQNVEPLISVNKIQLDTSSICNCELIMVQSDLEQILLNLVFNSKDAIKPNIGKITISSSFAHIASKRDLFGKEFLDGEYCVISVADTGKGISKDLWQAIFDPFKSYNQASSNHGLGLVTVLNIMNKYNGYITLESELDVGTTFSIYFPKDHRQLGTLAILNSQI